MPHDLKTWYCHKCREEAIKAYPDSWWLFNYAQHPIEEMKEDPEKLGFWLCERHQKVEV